MGQKVHPIGFRLGITQTHLSQWFAQKKNYSKYLFEDSFLRKTLQQRFREARFERIEIFRKIDNHLEIFIYAEKPEILVGSKGKDLKNFQQEIKKILVKNRNSPFFQMTFSSKYKKDSFSLSDLKVLLHITGCSKINASSIAEFLIELLEKRFPYRAALNRLFKKKLQTKSPEQGIKIQISGRLNGAEIARREWIREGRLPLQTLQATIDYSSKQAHTIYGVLGVKVWVFNPT